MVDCRRMDIDSRTCNVNVSQLCRLCALQDEHVVPIFEGDGLDLEFEIKLQKYLSLKVSRNDILPLNICLKCSNTLMSWHELVIGCEEAEKRLLSLLFEEDNRSDLLSNVILLNDDSQDSIKIIENDTTDVKPVSPRNNGLENFGFSDTGNANIQGHEAILFHCGGTVALLPNSAQSKDTSKVQHPKQLVINLTSPTSIGQNASSLTSKTKKSSCTKQPNTGLLHSRQSSSPPVVDSAHLESHDVGNKNNIETSLQPCTGQRTTSQSPSNPVIRKPIVDKSITLSGKKFKTIIKPFVLSRPESSTVDKPQPVTANKPQPVTENNTQPVTVSEPQPVTVNKSQPLIVNEPQAVTVNKPQAVTVNKPQAVTVNKPQAVTVNKPQPKEKTNIITLLIPGRIPPNSNPLLSTDSCTNTPIVTLPVILTEPRSPSSNQVLVPNISENAVLGYDPNSEIDSEDRSCFDLHENDNDSRGPSPCYSDNFTQFTQEPNVLKASTFNGPVTRSQVAQNAERTESGEQEAMEEQPVFVIAHEDHRYSKSAKLSSSSSSKLRNKEAASARKNLLKALKRKSKNRGCFICSKVIHNRTLLAAHERSHFKALDCLSYNCNVCTESFKTFEEMVSHRKKHKNKKRDALSRRTRPPKPKPTDGTESNPTGDDGDPSKVVKNKPKTPKRNPDEISPYIKCVICNLCFKNKHDLNAHKLTHTEEEKSNSYVCSTCGKRFSNHGAIKTHLKTHSEGPGELCSHCGRVFKLKTTLNQHIRKTHDVPNPWPKYQCEFCPRKFDSRTKLATHANCHTGDRPFKCDKCGKGFHSSSNLKQHLACHEDARPSMCHVCGKTFKWKKNLKQHALTHKASKEDPVQCDLCGKKLNGISSLKTHKYRFHRDVFFLENPDVQRLPCHLCSRVFSSTVNLDLHLRRFHADGQLRFVCDVCGKRFTTKVGRNDHLRLHTGERPYACNLCDKTFTCSSNLIAHRDAHSERRPHQCPHCDKQFKRKAHLYCHVRSHTGEKPYVCDICHRGFAQSNDMRKHRGTHFNERPFQCSFCENTFKKKKDLLRHLAKHCVSEQQEEDSDEVDYSAILPSGSDDIVAYEVC